MTKLFVSDTNSLISAAILPGSVSARAFFRAIDIGVLVVSVETISELKSVIFRKKFDKYFPNDLDRSAFLKSITATSINLQPKIEITACRDPRDNKFLELAIAPKASCIITGDDDLLVLNPFKEIPILNASDFLTAF